MESSEATIEELPTGGIERIGPAHAGRWTGLWIGLLGAIVGVAALGPSLGANPGNAPASDRSADPGTAPNVDLEERRELVTLGEPVAGEVEASGIVTAVGRNSGAATSLIVTVSIGSLILGHRSVTVEAGEPYAVRVPVATPVDGLALPAILTIADELDGRVLEAQSITVGGPPMIAWVAASTSRETIIKGLAPATATGIVVEAADGCATWAHSARVSTADSDAATSDERAAIAAFGRTSWTAILPPCQRVPTIVVRWSGVGGERGELYGTLTPLNVEPAPAGPGWHELHRAT